jgi:HEAT repeat protein
MKFLSKLLGKGKKSETGPANEKESAPGHVESKDAEEHKATSEPSGISNADPIASFLAKLNDRPSLSSYHVVQALVEIEDGSAMTALVAALGSDDVRTRRASVGAAESIAKSRLWALVGADLEDWQTEEVQLAVEIDDDRVVQVLVATLSDEEADADMRRSAIGALGALGQMGSPQGIEPLIGALDDEAFSVRFDAAEQLVRIYKEGRVGKSEARLIRRQESAIRSVLPPDRIEYLRKAGTWRF